MQILHAQPEHGPKRKLCDGDEAVVSRMGRCLVERLQRVHIGQRTQTKFRIANSASLKQEFEAGPDDPEYHAIKFLSLVLARSLFPDNFVRMRSLKLSRRGRMLLAAYYSDFVPDETEIIGRRRSVQKDFYSSDDHEVRDAIRERTDSEERLLNPEMSGLVSEFERFGLMMNHPEANYHVSGGDTVFFEVDGIRIDRILPRLQQEPKALLLLSEIYAVAVKAWLKNMTRCWEGDTWQSRNMREFEFMGFPRLVNFFYHLMRIEDNFARNTLAESHDIVKYDPGSWLAIMEKTQRGRCDLQLKQPPVTIDDEIFFLGS